MSSAPRFGPGMANSVMVPFMSMRPIRRAEASVNHIAWSGPAVMNWGPPPLGRVNSVTTPAVVMRPILLAWNSVNHRLPSGPAAIPLESALTVGMGKSVTTPAGVIRPTSARNEYVTHMLPSDPQAMSSGSTDWSATGSVCRTTVTEADAGVAATVAASSGAAHTTAASTHRTR